MALHFQMSEEAEEALRKAALRNKLSSMAACIGLIGGGCLILAMSLIYIAVEQEAEFIAYTPPADNLAPSAAPTTQQLSSKAATPSSVVSPAVIVATGAAPVAMAQVDVPMDDSEDIGMSMDIDLSMSMDLGEMGDDSAGMGSSEAGGSTLVGVFYDLKQTKSGAENSIGKGLAPGQHMPPAKRAAVIKVLNEFLERNWNKAVFNKYYQAKTKLYSAAWMLPSCDASYATKAFDCEKEGCKPSGWVAHYRGKVRAPKSGTFRFVGTADDLIAVRFDGKTVLEAGWCIPTMYDPKQPALAGNIGGGGPDPKNNRKHAKEYIAAIKAGTEKKHKGYEMIPFKETIQWNNQLGGLTAGTKFNVKQGEVYDIEILVSEVPGGNFGFALLIQDEEQMDKKQFDLFRTNFSLPDQEKTKEDIVKKMKMNKRQAEKVKFEFPSYNPDSLIWVSVP